MRLRNLPIESDQPVVTLALVRLGLTVVALVAAAVLGFPYHGRLTALLAGVALPWAVIALLLARFRPRSAVHPLMPVVDFGLLILIDLMVPEMYGAMRFAALLFVAVHAQLQGEQRGLVIAGGAAAALIVTGVLTRAPIGGGLLAFYDAVFAASCLATAVLVGRTRTTESASRLRARSLSRRTHESDAAVRKELAESIHDGPVQELIGLDMMLSAIRRAAEAGDREQVNDLLTEASELTERNVRLLRDEIVGLGPDAFQELSFEEALKRSVELWQRRYGIEVELAIERLVLPSEIEGDLFRIAQEAIANAGRHARARTVSVGLRRVDGGIELRVEDDGRGFRGVNPLGATESGHVGLAAMRERASVIGGRLAIESSEHGSQVTVLAPLTDGERKSGGPASG